MTYKQKSMIFTFIVDFVHTYNVFFNIFDQILALVAATGTCVSSPFPTSPPAAIVAAIAATATF